MENAFMRFPKDFKSVDVFFIVEAIFIVADW